MLTMAYIALAILGCGYILVAAFLGHLGDSAGGGHADGAHADGHAGAGASMTYGVEGGGHGTATADHGAPGAFHFPFFSPLALATLFASLGGFGLVAKSGFRVGDGASLLLALPAALGMSYAVTYAAWRLVRGSTGSSEIRLADLAGTSAEVTTPIPEGGVGEAAALVKGQRYSAPAREVDGRAVPRGAFVTVIRMAGTTLVVSSAPPSAGGKDGR